MVPSACFGVTPAGEPANVLRWRFRRDDEIVVLELSLTPDDAAYELHVEPPWTLFGGERERFDDAIDALKRQSALERILIASGWSLEAFESKVVARRSP